MVHADDIEEPDPGSSTVAERLAYRLAIAHDEALERELANQEKINIRNGRLNKDTQAYRDIQSGRDAQIASTIRAARDAQEKEEEKLKAKKTARKKLLTDSFENKKIGIENKLLILNKQVTSQETITAAAHSKFLQPPPPPKYKRGKGRRRPANASTGNNYKKLYTIQKDKLTQLQTTKSELIIELQKQKTEYDRKISIWLTDSKNPTSNIQHKTSAPPTKIQQLTTRSPITPTSATHTLATPTPLITTIQPPKSKILRGKGRKQSSLTPVEETARIKLARDTSRNEEIKIENKLLILNKQVTTQETITAAAHRKSIRPPPIYKRGKGRRPPPKTPAEKASEKADRKLYTIQKDKLTQLQTTKSELIIELQKQKHLTTIAHLKSPISRLSRSASDILKGKSVGPGGTRHVRFQVTASQAWMQLRKGTITIPQYNQRLLAIRNTYSIANQKFSLDTAKKAAKVFADKRKAGTLNLELYTSVDKELKRLGGQGLYTGDHAKAGPRKISQLLVDDPTAPNILDRNVHDAGSKTASKKIVVAEGTAYDSQPFPVEFLHGEEKVRVATAKETLATNILKHNDKWTVTTPDGKDRIFHSEKTANKFIDRIDTKYQSTKWEVTEAGGKVSTFSSKDSADKFIERFRPDAGQWTVTTDDGKDRVFKDKVTAERFIERTHKSDAWVFTTKEGVDLSFETEEAANKYIAYYTEKNNPSYLKSNPELKAVFEAVGKDNSLFGLKAKDIPFDQKPLVHVATAFIEPFHDVAAITLGVLQYKKTGDFDKGVSDYHRDYFPPTVLDLAFKTGLSEFGIETDKSKYTGKDGITNKPYEAIPFYAGSTLGTAALLAIPFSAVLRPIKALAHAPEIVSKLTGKFLSLAKPKLLAKNTEMAKNVKLAKDVLVPKAVQVGKYTLSPKVTLSYTEAGLLSKAQTKISNAIKTSPITKAAQKITPAITSEAKKIKVSADVVAFKTKAAVDTAIKLNPVTRTAEVIKFGIVESPITKAAQKITPAITSEAKKIKVSADVVAFKTKAAVDTAIKLNPVTRTAEVIKFGIVESPITKAAQKISPAITKQTDKIKVSADVVAFKTKAAVDTAIKLNPVTRTAEVIKFGIVESPITKAAQKITPAITSEAKKIKVSADVVAFKTKAAVDTAIKLNPVTRTAEVIKFGIVESPITKAAQKISPAITKQTDKIKVSADVVIFKTKDAIDTAIKTKLVDAAKTIQLGKFFLAANTIQKTKVGDKFIKISRSVAVTKSDKKNPLTTASKDKSNSIYKPSKSKSKSTKSKSSTSKDKSNPFTSTSKTGLQTIITKAAKSKAPVKSYLTPISKVIGTAGVTTAIKSLQSLQVFPTINNTPKLSGTPQLFKTPDSSQIPTTPQTPKLFQTPKSQPPKLFLAPSKSSIIIKTMKTPKIFQIPKTSSFTKPFYSSTYQTSPQLFHTASNKSSSNFQTPKLFQIPTPKLIPKNILKPDNKGKTKPKLKPKVKPKIKPKLKVIAIPHTITSPRLIQIQKPKLKPKKTPRTKPKPKLILKVIAIPTPKPKPILTKFKRPMLFPIVIPDNKKSKSKRGKSYKDKKNRNWFGNVDPNKIVGVYKRSEITYQPKKRNTKKKSSVWDEFDTKKKKSSSKRKRSSSTKKSIFKF